jgi:hypothetical protein
MPIKFKMHDSPSVADVLLGINIGKVWYAIPPANTNLGDLKYDIPEGRVLPTITAGNAALVAGQNDHLVICAHSDHDTDEWAEATIALAKHSINIIGLNKPRIGGAADIFTLAGADNTVLAGLFIQPASGMSGIVVDSSDHWTIRDCIVSHEATAAASYCLEIGNTAAANFGKIVNNYLFSGLNGAFLEICNDLLIKGNIFAQTGAASTIGIEETLTDGTALRIFIVDNYILMHETTATGIKLANDTSLSHFISNNHIIGAATPITQDKFDEGVGPNYIYSATAVAATVDPTA